jgi:hypothetical protein
MVDVEADRFTVAVFQDAVWARKGLDALTRAGFSSGSLSILAKDGPDAAALFQHAFGAAGDRRELPLIGPVIAKGALVEALEGSQRDFSTLGIAGTMRRIGFQPHDGQIFETLTARGGVLMAIQSAPRAADALAIFHSYGGGNAAIGAWTGRV